MSSTSTQRLPVGRRLLPAVFDEWATLEPEKLAGIFPVSSRMDEWHSVTYSEYSKAVNSLAWYIKESVGVSDTHEVISYIGANDFRYPVFWLAAMKCGYCTLNPSPRNSNEEQAFLMEETGCTQVFYSKEWEPKVEAMRASVRSPLKSFLVPSYMELLRRTEAKRPYPFDKTFEELVQKPALIFHTSGSTGRPKPRFLTHGYMSTMDSYSLLPVPEGRQPAVWAVERDDTYFTSFPAFHASGGYLLLLVPVFKGAVPVQQSPEVPLSESSILKMAEKIDLTAAFLIPSFIEDIYEATETESLKCLGRLKYVFFGAGPLSQNVGDYLAERTNLIQLYGSTETAVLPSLIQEKWDCIEWNPNYGFDMDNIDNSGLHELVIRKSPRHVQYQAAFHVFPDITEWRTKDLWTREQSNPDRWRFYGRADEVIVLSNGEKFSPVLMERHIAAHPLVVACVIVGQGRFQTALILEPDYGKWDVQRDPEEFIDMVWPSIQEANQAATATGQVFRTKVLVTKPDKPLVRTDKGSLSRARSVTHFAAEIDALYAKTNTEAVVQLPETVDLTSMKEFVRKCLDGSLPMESMEDDTDLFAANMDSLQTVGFVSTIRTSLRASLGEKAEAWTVAQYRKMAYENPSITKMARRLIALIHEAQSSDKMVDSNHDAQSERESKLAAMIEKYTSDLESNLEPDPGPPRATDICVILTGSTGSLGTYLLRDLCSTQRISKVYCFNRNPSALEQARATFAANDLPLALLSKAEFLHVSFGKPDFGLDSAKYKEIVENADLIIHNAWTVNFNHVVESFEDPHIKGIRNFVDLSRRGRHHPHVFFVSSIGTIGEYSDSEPVPEVVFEHFGTTAHLGYAESKHVAERILTTASKKTVTSATILRLGQVAGPTTEKGRWNETEWFATLIRTSKALGKLPSSLGGVDDNELNWIPLDTAARVCVELALNASSERRTKLHVFHLVNPNPARWSNLRPTVEEYFTARGMHMEVVSYKEWVDCLRQVHAQGLNHDSLKELPALKLLDYFEGLIDAQRAARIGTSKAQAFSKTLEQLQATSPALMERWLAQWNY